MGVKAVRRSDTERRKTKSWVECPRKNETTTQHKWLQLLGIIILLHGQKFLHAQAHTCTHKWTIQGMLTPTVSYVPSVLRGNLRNGTVRNFRYLKQYFTFLLVKEFRPLLFCESTEHLRLIHQLRLFVSYPESMLWLKTRTNAYVLYAGIKQAAD